MTDHSSAAEPDAVRSGASAWRALPQELTVASARTWMLRLPQNREHRDSPHATMELVGLDVESGGGSTGLGYTFTISYGGGEAVKALLDHVLVPRILGRSVNDYPAMWDEMWRATRRLGSGISHMAIAAVDIALWDLRARSQGLSLAKALGQVHHTVPTYSSGRASPTLPTEQLVEASLDSIAHGHTAIKLRVGMHPGEDTRRVAAVRDAVGPDVRIMCDANERLDLPTAQWLGRRLLDHDVFWFEEPLPSEHVDGYRQLASTLPLAITGGEHLFSLWEFTRYVEREAISILQPDVCMVGGVTEWLRIANLGLAHGLPVSPHFVPELHVHLAAATPNAMYVESFPMFDELTVHELEVREGHMSVPDRLGHGVEFHPWVHEKYGVDG
jgi:L-alanine-DL-glutamate epimerase-like enolase superfamily enzyme